MKKSFLSVIAFLTCSMSFSQAEQLEGIWVLDSIFDYDIMIEYPENEIRVYFAENITIDSSCFGNDYVSEYQNVQDQTFEIPQTSWTPLR
ncbi:MAG: hypothetical protein HRU26_10835 [Psychroserpens sp.]|nr:hypothetical protein [Psychroserpens sp.]